MNIEKLLETLHPLERKVLPFLDKFNNIPDLTQATGLKDVEVMRALQWLSNKEVLTIKEDLKEVVELDNNGKTYLQIGLPERRFIQAIDDNRFQDIDSMAKEQKLEKGENNICLCFRKKNSTINS